MLLAMVVSLAGPGRAEAAPARPATTPPSRASQTEAPPAGTAPKDTSVSGMAAAELLAFAREVAATIPTDPHLKDRARALQAVSTAAMKAGDIEGAAAVAREIPNWRRGVVLAELAIESAKAGDRTSAERFLEEAARAEKDAAADVASGQEWRRDRIRVAMAQAHELLGASDAAKRLEQGVVNAEVGKVDAVRAGSGPAEAFDERLAALDGLLAQGTFDVVRNACRALTELHRRHASESDRRAAIERRIRAAWSLLPISERVSLLLALSTGSAAAGDRATAIAFATEARDVVSAQRWLLEDEVPLQAAIAGAFVAAADLDTARRIAAAAGAAYEQGRSNIADVFRAAAIRPLAEAWASIGDRTEALRLYRMAIEDGALNANARPRALDLSATAASMLLAGVEPDDALWARMREIRGALGAPW